MLLMIDLTPRQAGRVLEQARRARVKLEIEPRNRPNDEPLVGTLEELDPRTLRIDLHGAGSDQSLTNLIGAFADVRMTLSGQSYLFTACITDTHDAVSPPRLSLGLPGTVHLANRRRFPRLAATVPAPVRLRVALRDDPERPAGRAPSDTFNGILGNVGPQGLACRMNRAEVEPLVLLGDEVRVTFELPGRPESYELPAIVCDKHAGEERDQLILGLEFELASDEPRLRATAERLHAALYHLAEEGDDVGDGR
ncbi:MAG: PilZ domain-containing protein [Phycisphaerae bacterium]